MKSVALFGFSEFRDLIHESTAQEVWTLNNAYNKGAPMERVTRWYEMHDPEKFTGSEHYDFLAKQHTFPIMMLRKYTDFPSSVEYPLSCIADNLDGERMYFTNTISYMLAHAIVENYDRIELYGIDMDHGTEYAYQKASAEYILGIAIGRGIEIVLPDGCSMLNAPLYGYDANVQNISVDDIQRHRDYYLALYDAEPEYNERACFLDGAQAHCAMMMARYGVDKTVSRHVVELNYATLLNQFQKATSDYNLTAGKLAILEEYQIARPDIAEENGTQRRHMYELDGAVQALKNMALHLDIKPYNLNIETSLK